MALSKLNNGNLANPNNRSGNLFTFESLKIISDGNRICD
jgi:hypothetical protein